ncbi:uncharacterized protein F4807DRAFT_432930 [Annulohypoxylon truncatum]|uniref:uncharacterized protein n=1 Tax=Annulohypoxylon truncatum TaxID=327061 RepID=UPI0020078B26|nr:uncharacterized protein F4807DRAFT_432930 [Annulohypoxylon truncatum]KAI1208029.1 hypothetical protein F4807DRAFT_432930 [Annulohypoxylon truncatum]
MHLIGLIATTFVVLAFGAALPYHRGVAANRVLTRDVEEDDTAIVYNYGPSGVDGIEAPGTSGTDDDDAIAYT